MENIKKIAIFEAAIILVLLVMSFNGINLINKPIKNDTPLLSQRIGTGNLMPKSGLTFNFAPLKSELINYIDKNNLNTSLYVLNMRDGASFGINGNAKFEAVSLNKLPVAIIILRKVEEGKLNLDTKLKILDEDRSSAYGTLYLNPVKELPVKELIRLILQESDNTAFNVLTRQITIEDGLALTNYLDYYQNNISYAESPKSLEITPKTTSNLFMSLYLSTILEPEHSQLILQYLTNTSYDIKKAANLPENVTVAQKFGSFDYENNKFFHSCGIMYIDESRLFYCVMTEGTEIEQAKQSTGEIVNKIYNYIIVKRNQDDNYS